MPIPMIRDEIFDLLEAGSLIPLPFPFSVFFTSFSFSFSFVGDDGDGDSEGEASSFFLSRYSKCEVEALAWERNSRDGDLGGTTGGGGGRGETLGLPEVAILGRDDTTDGEEEGAGCFNCEEEAAADGADGGVPDDFVCIGVSPPEALTVPLNNLDDRIELETRFLSSPFSAMGEDFSESLRDELRKVGAGGSTMLSLRIRAGGNNPPSDDKRGERVLEDGWDTCC